MVGFILSKNMEEQEQKMEKKINPSTLSVILRTSPLRINFSWLGLLSSVEMVNWIVYGRSTRFYSRQKN